MRLLSLNLLAPLATTTDVQTAFWSAQRQAVKTKASLDKYPARCFCDNQTRAVLDELIGASISPNHTQVVDFFAPLYYGTRETQHCHSGIYALMNFDFAQFQIDAKLMDALDHFARTLIPLEAALRPQGHQEPPEVKRTLSELGITRKVIKDSHQANIFWLLGLIVLGVGTLSCCLCCYRGFLSACYKAKLQRA
jgi:hypothetical protein